ncbi:MAG TPA: hypothetical protein VHF88_10735 [Thermoleophilaceae bacterium]|nr:hypothetical protein [Thermoleophilaceae bacterium]
MSKADALIDAAIARLARGDGEGSLRDLGIDRPQLVRDSGVSRGVIDYHFAQRGQGDALRGLADAVLERLLAEQLRLREEASGRYNQRAQFVADGAGRRTIAQALLDELARYGAVADADDDLTRARERAYYLAVALCDVRSSDSQRPIAEDGNHVPDHRFRRHVVEMHQRPRAALLQVYADFLATAGREPEPDIERLVLVMSAFLEGVVLRRRIAHGHGEETAHARAAERPLALGDDDLVDAALRIFIAMSRPVGGSRPDPDAILFARDGAAAQAASETVLHRDRAALYETILEAIGQLSAEDALSHCALHTSGVGRSRSEQGEALKRSLADFLDRGGRLRNIEKVNSVAELDATVTRLAAGRDAGHDQTFRVLVMDSPPGLSPLLIGDRMALLGRDVDGQIVDGVAFCDAAGREWCETHYDSLWHDDRAYTLASPNGLNDRGIGDARRQLEELERRRKFPATAG